MEPSYQRFLVCAFATRLENTQVDAALMALIMDYLVSRPQLGYLQNCVSEHLICNTGATQGSVLYPFLSNHIHNRFHHFQMKVAKTEMVMDFKSSKSAPAPAPAPVSTNGADVESVQNYRYPVVSLGDKLESTKML